MKLVSSTEAIEALGITQATLFKWIWLKKIKVHRYQIGKRIYNGFEPEEIERIKSIMVGKRQHGKPILKDE